MNRSERALLAKETVEIIERRNYRSSSGVAVDLEDKIHHCLEETRLYLPDQLEEIRIRVLAEPPRFNRTALAVRNETTLAGARSLLGEGYGNVGALNFASAKNPGGGFLGGSLAQEESLAMSSALYGSLLRAPEYYEFHRSCGSCLYSDRMIFSPACPVFRDDEGALLSEPYLISFITSPAPNAGAVYSNEPAKAAEIPEVLARRAELVLGLAAHHGVEALVLGAWGCGVFRNDPAMVAEAFAGLLRPGKGWHGRFKKVVFSVLDFSKEQTTLQAFASALAEH